MIDRSLKDLKYRSILFVFLLLLGIGINAQPPSHDPSRIQKDGDRYWSFYTHDGIAALSASSPDFSDWQSEGTVLGDTWPSWINTYVPDFAGQFWAPSCIYMNNQYYLYYSCSTMGAFQSAIGVMATPSLNDPDWMDYGMVVHSGTGNAATISNAIDPALFKDDDGKVWMTYGSWHGGISIIEIDSITGKTKGSVTRLVGGNHQDYEAPYLLKHDGYYYLFVNRGLCCRGVNSTYYIQVGRSTSVTGTYSGWRTFLDTDNRFIGPGHVGYNQGRLTYHVYDRDDGGSAKMINTTMSWEDGWPVADAVSQEPSGVAIPNGTYRIQTSDVSKIIGVQSNNPYVGASVQVLNYVDDDIDGNSWVLTNEGNNQYKISPANFSELGMDVYNCVGDDGANIGLWSYWGGSCQKWNFVDMGNEIYQIRSVLSNKPLHIDGTIAGGTNIVQMRNEADDPNQLFTLELLEPEDTTGKDSEYPKVISYSAYQDGNPPDNILDGNESDASRWSAEGFPQSVTIDYGENILVKGVRVSTYQDRAYQYIVELDEEDSFDNAFIVDRSTNVDTDQPISDDFEPIMARYARITITGAASYSGSWVSITEFEIVENTTGINQTLSTVNDLISIYPVPVSNLLTFSSNFQCAVAVSIYNSLGQLKLSMEEINPGLTNIDVSDFSKGVYIVVMKDGQNIGQMKFVKQ